MTVKQYFAAKNPWIVECSVAGCRAMTVDIAFSSPESNDDEVEFCIGAYNTEELNELFSIFCQENSWREKEITIQEICIVRAAETMDALIDYEKSCC